jgi:hypothetical protein
MLEEAWMAWSEDAGRERTKAWMQASDKATVLDCMGGDGEGNCASLQASVPTLHSRRILPQPRYSGSYLGRNGCPLAVDRLHSRSLKEKDAWTAHFDLRLNADDVTAAPPGGFSRPEMLKENQERIAWFDNYQPDRTNETHRTSN